MSALWRGAMPASTASGANTLLRPMSTVDLDAVMGVEVAAYAFPWSRGNFVDSIAAGYTAQVLVDGSGELVAYLVAMDGVDEMHLLNITVAPARQGHGHARALLQALMEVCRARGAKKLWLEVRAGNERARAVYGWLGFGEVGRRKAYYPAGFGRREDAIVMSLPIEPSAPVGERPR